MILGPLSMLAANAAVTLGAVSITQRVSSGRRSVDVLLFLLARYTLIATAVLATGLARCLNPIALGILALVGLGVWAATGEHRRFPRFAMPDLAWPLWLAIAVIAARLLWQVWVFAPYSVDPLSYHLPKLAWWIQHAALLPYPGADVRETWPAGFELLETWWCVFLHHDVLIEMAGLEFLALGAAAAAALARAVGLAPRSSAFAAVLYAITPAPILHATACMNDGPVASVILTTLTLAAVRAHPLLIASAAAVGVGIKPTFACVIPGAALLFFLERRTPLLPVRCRACAVTLAALAIAVGSFWYGLNTVRFGNPTYPVGSLDTVERESKSGVGLLGKRLNDLTGQAVYDERDQTTVQFYLSPGWGLLMFSCGGVALIAMARSNAALRRLAAAFGITLLAAITLAPFGVFYFRFLMFFPALGAIAVAAFTERYPGSAPLPWAAAVLCFLSTLRPGDLSSSMVQALLKQDWQTRCAGEQFGHIPDGETILCLSGTHDDSNGASYSLYGPGFTRRIVYVPRIESREDLFAQLAKHHATWIYSLARNGDGRSRAIILEAARDHRLDGWRTLHRIPPP